MANEFYTLIVVPHAKARFRKFQVSVRLTKWVLTACGVMGLVLVGILAHYTWIAVEVAEVRRLRVENLALAAKARAYEENAGQLQAKVLQLQSVVTKLGLMAGVEERVPEESVGGVGGLSRAETLPPSVDIASTLREPRQHGQPALGQVEAPRDVLQGPEGAARLDAVDLAGARLPVGRLRQPDRPVHGPARLPPRDRHLDPPRDEGPGAGRRRRGLLRASRAATATRSSSTTASASSPVTATWTASTSSPASGSSAAT